MNTAVGSTSIPSPVPIPDPHIIGALIEPSKELGGVDRSNGVGREDAIVIGGEVEKKKAAAFESMTALPEDSTKPYAVIVGSKEFRDKAAASLKASGVGEFFHVVGYDPGKFQVKDVGYTPGIWLVSARGPDGKADIISYDETLDRTEGPVKRFVEALRKNDGILDRLKIPEIAAFMDPWPHIMDYVLPALILILNCFLFGFIIVQVARK